MTNSDRDKEFLKLNNALKRAAIECLWPLGYVENFVISTDVESSKFVEKFREKFLEFCDLQNKMVELLSSEISTSTTKEV